MTPPSDLRDRLRYLLDASGLKRKELSLLCGLRHSYFGSLFRQRRPEMGSSRLAALAFTLNISIDWLLKNEGPRPTKADIRAAIKRARAEPGAAPKKVEEALGPLDVEGAPLPELGSRPKRTASPPPASPPRPVVKALPRRRSAASLTTTGASA